MKKRLIMLGLVFFVFSCETGLEVNLECWLKHTAEVVKVEGSILGEKDRVFINLTWGWLYQRPDGDAVIVERSIGDTTHFVVVDTVAPIDTVMFFNDTDPILAPNDLVYYRLNYLKGKATDYFKTTKVAVPPAQNFYKPATDFISIANDTLEVFFARLTGFGTTDIAIYKAGPSSIDSLLNFLTSPMLDTTIADTSYIIAGADTLFPVDSIFTIKLSSSKILDYITDTSIGFRAFRRQQ